MCKFIHNRKIIIYIYIYIYIYIFDPFLLYLYFLKFHFHAFIRTYKFHTVAWKRKKTEREKYVVQGMSYACDFDEIAFFFLRGRCNHFSTYNLSLLFLLLFNYYFSIFFNDQIINTCHQRYISYKNQSMHGEKVHKSLVPLTPWLQKSGLFSLNLIA